MRRHARLERALALLGAVTLLVVGFDSLTYAATGSSLLLGKLNRAGAVTTVQNTGSGAALSLLTRSTSSPPLTTNAKGLVPNLYAGRAANADKVGGQTPTQIQAAVRAALAAGSPAHLVGTAGEPGFAATGGPFVWRNYPGFSPTSFRKDPLGVVHIGGLVCLAQFSCVDLTGTVTTPFQTIFVLPVGFRPAARTLFAIQETDRVGRVDVLPTGEVQFQWIGSVNHSYVALDGISFVAGG